MSLGFKFVIMSLVMDTQVGIFCTFIRVSLRREMYYNIGLVELSLSPQEMVVESGGKTIVYYLEVLYLSYPNVLPGVMLMLS